MVSILSKQIIKTILLYNFLRSVSDTSQTGGKIKLITAWCDQNLSNCALNALTMLAFTTEFGKLFKIFTTRAENKCFRKSQ